ncbi:HNH endonuclease family protein [Salinilacihabitans rarus]|uniref:HNH endonuclease family protein n=1 Tax=Salinilacihabitans rarus TaxID=2961596 RepID=UPI0020C8CE4B|nr:HNH endonuclease family protein [Salinilacihabitans rarus]
MAILGNMEDDRRKKEYLRLAAILSMRMMLADYRSSDRKKAIHNAAVTINKGEDIKETLIQHIHNYGPEDAEIIEHQKANSMPLRGQWRFRTLLTLVSIEEERRGPLMVEIDNLHIEHIAPRNTFGSGRRNSYSNWKRRLNRDEFEDAKDRLGNLTLLSPEDHGRLDESSFTSKRNVYRNSDIKIAEEVSEYDGWSVEEIERRTEILAGDLVSKWSI